MATLTPVIRKDRKRSDGSYAIKIRLTHKRRTVYIPTALTAWPSDLNTRGRLKPSAVQAASSALTARMYAAMDDLPLLSLDLMDVEAIAKHIMARLQRSSFKLDFVEFGRQWVAMQHSLRPATKAGYMMALKHFERWVGHPVDINAIRPVDVRHFVQNELTYQTATSVRSWVLCLHRIFKEAKAEYNDESSDVLIIAGEPFANLAPKVTGHKRARVLEGWELQMIIDADDTTPRERYALDMLLFSFATMGMNVADMFYLAPPTKGWLNYCRRKTETRRIDHAQMRIRMLPEAKALAERIGKGEDGRYLRSISNSAHGLLHMLNKYIKAWGRRHGMGDITTYTARRTWATIARSRLGIEKATVDECLVHVGDFPIADMYIERNWDQLTEANRKVLATLDWSAVTGEKSKNLIKLAASS